MRYSLILIFILGIYQFIVVAQSPTEKTGCPVFSVSSPNYLPVRGETITFRLVVDRNLDSDIKLKWTVSYGKIISGQGTQSIIVENYFKKIGEITVVVEVSGLPENCSKTAQVFLNSDYPDIPSTIKVDEFGTITNKILVRKISSLSKNLKDPPNTTAYIVKSFAKSTNKLKAYLYLQLILNYLKSNDIDEERIIFLIITKSEETNEFWVASTGAYLPSSDSEYEHLNAAVLKRKIIELSKKW